MKRNNPTRIVETGRVVRGQSGQPLGWLQSFAERYRNLLAQAQGIHERVTTPLRNGVPSCVNGELVFKADTNKTVTLTNFPIIQDLADGDNVFTTLTANPIVKAGQTYRVPVTFTPPGVLEAHNLVVGIEVGEQQWANTNRTMVYALNDYRQVLTWEDAGGQFKRDGGGGLVATERGMSWTQQQQVLGDGFSVMPFLPYLWNIIDEKSGRQYAQDWMPSGALLNTRGNAQGYVLNNDSELFEFDTPWLFERDAQVAFLFRPIMDLYQIAAADSSMPYGSAPPGSVFGNTAFDDRTGGRREAQATVRVEFHGNRYYTSQDVLKDGALVTNAYDPSQQNRPQRRRP